MTCLSPVFIPKLPFPVPCGKCENCCITYSNMWSQRIVDEASTCSESCFVTLTYKVTDGNLHKEDLQKFWKRLRKKIDPVKIRYFACGEYGGKNNRPHYHAIIFGWRPPDLSPAGGSDDQPLYKSDFLADVWSLGFVSVGNVTIRSAKYCAKYLQKLDLRSHDVKPFTVMSRRPGLGQSVVSPEMLITGIRYFDGRAFSIPRYYLQELEKQGFNVDALKARRAEVSKNLAPEYWTEEDFARLRREKKFSDEKLSTFVH